MLKHSEEIKEIAQAICAAEAEMGSATELNGVNDHFKNRFSTLSAILKVVKPALNRHGIALIQSSTIQDKLVTVETMLIHGASGQFITDSITLSVPQTLIQVYGSAISYGRRYALQAMLAMCGDDSVEDDGEAAMGNTNTSTANSGFKGVEFKSADKPVEVKATTSAPEVKKVRKTSPRVEKIRTIFGLSAQLHSPEQMRSEIGKFLGWDKPIDRSGDIPDSALDALIEEFTRQVEAKQANEGKVAA